MTAAALESPRATVAEIHAANDLAMRVWRQEQEATQTYLTTRGFDADAIKELGFDIGHAGRDGRVRRTLEAHGFPLRVAAAAGLVRARDNGGVIDSFRNRLMFAIRSVYDGAVAGFTGRATPQAHRDAPRWLNTRTTAAFRKGEMLYGLWESRCLLDKRRERPVAAFVVCEGPLDAIAVTLACPAVAVAPAGTAMTDTQARWIADMASAARLPVVVACDGDEAGHRAGEKSAGLIAGCPPEVQVSVAVLPDGEDPASLAVSDPAGLCRQLMGSAGEAGPSVPGGSQQPRSVRSMRGAG